MKTIQLDTNWKIEADTYSWKLTFSEERTKEKLNKKREKTGETEQYIYEDSWYFPSIKMCLDKYLTEVFKVDNSISEMIDRLSAIESKVNEIEGIFNKELALH